MQRDSKIQALAVLTLAASLAVSGVLATELAASIGRNKLGYADRAEEGQPPQVAIGIAMGAFRGLFVNFLWIRANKLKEEGKYYEAIDLAQAITQLQPRFPRVWVFHAWNMAYNISVATQTREERWRWVQAGIRLLRDQGIVANPNDMLLHKELAWIYLHKIQGYTDDANVYYKKQVAAEWTTVLGPPPPPDPLERDRDRAIERYAQWLGAIVDAPDTAEQLVNDVPAAGTLLARLESEVGVRPGLELLGRYEYLRALKRSGSGAMIRASFGPKMTALAALADAPTLASAWDALLAHTRKRALIDDYHMEPIRMVRYTRKYGPIDWRNPAAHALYWSARGVEQALGRVGRQNEDDYDFVNTDRVVIQSVQELYRTGEIYFDYLVGQYFTMMNAHFVESYGDILSELVERSRFDTDRRAFSFYSGGYENFLKDAIRFYYRRGQRDLAQQYYDLLATIPTQNLNDPDRPYRFALPLDEFVTQDLFDRYTSPSVAHSEVVGSLLGAYAGGLLSGDDELFTRQLEYANQFHRYFMERQLRQNIVSPDDLRMAQMNPDFRLLAGSVFADLMGVLALDDAERMYDNAPGDLKLYAYDVLERNFKEAMEADRAKGGRPFNEVFPEPPNLEPFRRAMERRREQEQSELNIAPK